MMSTKPRGPHKTLSFAEKLAALREVERGVKRKSQIAKQFGIPPTTLSTYIKNKEKIFAHAVGNNNLAGKRAKRPGHPDIDECVLKWFKETREQKIPVTGTLIRAKAEELAMSLGRHTFKASSGWLDGFKKRNGIFLRNDSDVQKVDFWKTELMKTIKDVPAKDIFNVAETGLFYKCTPEKTPALKDEHCGSGKLSRERITLLMGANMDGTEKLPLLMIGKIQSPKCFRNVKTKPVEYIANSEAWMTSEIFGRWLLQLDQTFREQNRTILLFINDCPAHITTPYLTNIKIEYFPSYNMTSVQPMDQGVIKNFKYNYRRLLLKNVLSGALLNKKNKIKINLLEAGHMCNAAWEEVSTETIANCFRRAGFTKAEEDEYMVVEVRPPSWENGDAFFEGFINFEEKIETCEALTKKTCSNEDKAISKHAQVLTHLQEVRKYVEDQPNAPIEVFYALDKLQQFIFTREHKSEKQMKISDFFKPQI